MKLYTEGKFRSLNMCPRKDKSLSAILWNNLSIFLFSHVGHIRILEVSPSGKYIRLFNSSSFQVSVIPSCYQLSLSKIRQLYYLKNMVSECLKCQNLHNFKFLIRSLSI